MYNELFLSSDEGGWYLRGLKDDIVLGQNKPLDELRYNLNSIHKVSYDSANDTLTIVEVTTEPTSAPTLTETFMLNQQPMLRIVSHSQFKHDDSDFNGVFGIEDIEPMGVTTHIIPFTIELTEIYFKIKAADPDKLIIMAF